MFKFIIACLAVSLAAGASASADVLELKDGTILDGRFAGGTGLTVRFETSDGIKILERGDLVALTFTTSPPTGTPGTPAADLAAAPAQQPPAQPQTVTIPPGTTLLVRMMDSISSQNKPGTRFTTTLDNDLAINGAVALKAGTRIYGELQSAKKARRAIGKSQIDIRLTQVAVGSQTYAISTDNFQETGASSGRKTLGAAAVGAGVGAVVDGGEGAGKGAAIAGGVSLLKKGETVTVPPGMLLEFQLTQPLTITTGS